MTIIAKIIDPNKRKTRVTCSECGLSYSAKNYKIHYDNEKLAFFKMKLPDQRTKIFCHDCMQNCAANSIGVLKELILEIHTLDDKVTVVFKK